MEEATLPLYHSSVDLWTQLDKFLALILSNSGLDVIWLSVKKKGNLPTLWTIHRGYLEISQKLNSMYPTFSFDEKVFSFICTSHNFTASVSTRDLYKSCSFFHLTWQVIIQQQKQKISLQQKFKLAIKYFVLRWVMSVSVSGFQTGFSEFERLIDIADPKGSLQKNKQ